MADTILLASLFWKQRKQIIQASLETIFLLLILWGFFWFLFVWYLFFLSSFAENVELTGGFFSSCVQMLVCHVTPICPLLSTFTLWILCLLCVWKVTAQWVFPLSSFHIDTFLQISLKKKKKQKTKKTFLLRSDVFAHSIFLGRLDPDNLFDITQKYDSIMLL